MDVIDVKNMLGIKTDKHDSYLVQVIPLFIEIIKDKCNNKFLNENGDESLPAGVQVAVAKWCEYNMHTAGVNSKSQGVTYSYDTDIPPSILRLIRPYRKLRFE